jgi:nucleotide-binding universal stress UspA family protein
MFQRVLLCYDGSDAGRRALKRGAELAILLKAQAHVLLITSSGIDDPFLAAGATGHACILGDATNRHEKMLSESVEWLRARGISAQSHITQGNIVDQIVAYTKKLGIDLIVLGHYPRPSGGFWWGASQRGSLAERAHCCVFVAVDNPGDPVAAPVPVG